jgi:putative PIN family toxin of toxin-antitoxin system
MRVVLDSNVLVRATGHSSGPARAVFLRLLEPPHSLIASKHLLDELRRVLNYPRVRKVHGLSMERIEQHLADVAASAETVDLPVTLASIVPHDPDDDPIVATAVYGRADVLCTRDRHLHRPKVVEYCQQFEIRILTDTGLLDELRKLDREPSQ